MIAATGGWSTELIARLVDRVLELVLGVVELLFHLAGGLVGFTLAPQLVVVGEVARRLLGAALGLIELSTHVGCLLVSDEPEADPGVCSPKPDRTLVS